MLTHLRADTSGDEVAAAIRRDGGVIVDGLADDAFLDAFFDEMQPHVEATPMGPDDFSGRQTRRTGGLLARSRTAQALVMDPLVTATVGDILGHVASYQLHLTQIIEIGAGNPGQPIHRDQWAFDFFPFPTGYDVQCNTIWAGDDFTEENGATRIVVGSHLLEDGLRFSVEDSVPAEMERGSVLFYNGAVYHGGGENRTDEARRGINITYNVSWLRQEENQYLTIPREVAREFPEELQRLVGYQRGAYALGYIDDLRDPIDVLRDPADAGGIAGFGGDIDLEARVDTLGSES
jgi:ectoine hydroxylase-related dioxygenase (phytanoyl-CoA dioxygenase family)